MSIYSLVLGRQNDNIAYLENPLFLKKSKFSVVPGNVSILLKENRSLFPGTFETLRAHGIGIVIGGTLILAIGTLFATVIYGFYQQGVLTGFIEQVGVVVSVVAEKILTLMSSNHVALVASVGGAATFGAILARSSAASAIGAFCGALLGTLTGSGLVGVFKGIAVGGYNWWYDSYHFSQRLKKIERNKEVIFTILKQTYDDMAEALKSSTSPRRVEIAKNLKDHLDVIRLRIEKHGISKSDIQLITLEFEKAISSVS